MQRPGSALSKLKMQQQNLKANVTQKSVQKKTYTKEEFIRNRDFEGAITLLEHEKLLNKDNLNNQLWLAYSYYHSGDFPKALSIYRNLTKKASYDLNIHTYIACCLYALTKYKEGLEEAKKGIPSDLNNRVRFHLAFKLGDGNEVLEAHQKLNQNSVPDELSLAALHYLKNEQEEAIEIYKKILGLTHPRTLLIKSNLTKMNHLNFNKEIEFKTLSKYATPAQLIKNPKKKK